MTQKTVTDFAGDDQRRFQRISVLWNGECSSEDSGMSSKCVIFDISVNGVRARFEQGLAVGTRLVINISNGVQFISEVVWSRGQVVGLRFKDSPEKLASIMAGILPLRCLEFI
ncbi:PilZ domain-containing protein [Kiloniella laminariae]|uniref:PilZ domain-containing protein n=2 Tax=Kiloniella laminariae TaxID=454162 RepID=A0ABT4LH73_9PROT|nr:PilZ domain-containing protein [Kiloniella laminariae]